MPSALTTWLANKISAWLTVEIPADRTPLCDFDRLSYEIRPADVILVEGRTRVSEVIKNITQSPWTHSALYIGRLADIEDRKVRDHVAYLYDGDDNDQLIIEALLGEGTIVRSLKKYTNDHLRICRPSHLSRQDAQAVIHYAIQHLGCDYDIRQLLDLARLLLPYGVLPRRWRSSLFEHNAGIPTRTVCSSMLASAFNSVHFPVLPVVQRHEDGRLKLYKRNSKLYTPRDFDYSPYFDIIKYPYIGIEDRALYRSLPWDEEGQVCNGHNDCFIPQPSEILEQPDMALPNIVDASSLVGMKKQAPKT